MRIIGSITEMVYAYLRISTDKDTQKTDRQRHAINEFLESNEIKISKVEFIEEVVSGKVEPRERPKYSELVKRVSSNDILIVTDLDRLGRDADSTISEVRLLHKADIKLVVLDMPYLNDLNVVQGDSTPYKIVIDILVTLKAHLAEQEREKLSERVKQGLKATDKKLGRPKTTVDDIPSTFIKHYNKYLLGHINKSELSKLSGLSRVTVDKYIKLTLECEDVA